MLPFHIRIRDSLTSVFTVNKVIHHARLQRTGTEQRHQGYHVFKAVRTQTLDQILHAAGFKLENRCGFRALQHIKAFLVVERDSRDIHRRLAFFLIARVNHAQRPVNNRQCAQTEEVKLHQTGIFHVVFIKLCDRVIPFRVAVKRCEIGNFCRRDHHTTCVFTGVTCHPFQDARHIDQRPDFLIGLIHLAELRLCRKGFFQCHTGIRRHQFGNSVDKPVRMPQHTADIADNRFCRHRTEGNNLGNSITPVHFGYVINHAVTFFHAEVNIEVRHGNSFRVQEAFEQEIKLQRIQIGDFQGVRHQRTGTGTTSRPYRHIVILRPLDKLHHDQEVAGEAHLVNHFQFNIQTLVIFRTALRTHFRIREQERQALLQPLFRAFDQIIFRAHIPGRELRQEILTKADGDVTTLSNFDAVLQCFRDVGEQLAHLVLTAQILLRAVEFRTFRIR